MQGYGLIDNKFFIAYLLPRLQMAELEASMEEQMLSLEVKNAKL